MSWVTRHLRVGLVLMLLVLLASLPLRAGAATSPALIAASAPKVIITELQTTGTSASEEFVEFYNTTDTDIDFADSAHSGKDPWKLQFFSATATTNGTPDWSKPSATVSLTGIVPAHGYYVLASTSYAPGGIDADQLFSSRLSDTGGGLQLITAGATATTYFDRLMWKQTSPSQTMPALVLATPAPKGSLQRQPNDDNEYVSADGVLSDFTLAADISPKDMWRPPLPPEIPEVPPIETPPADDTNTAPESPAPGDNTGLAAPIITELLPNPASPLKDETDEFIELYNPNTTAFDLKGYTLEVGTSTLHDFTFTDGAVLSPLSYMAFYSRDTNLSLTNSGGQARLLDPAGTTLNETGSYDAAGDGLSWSFDKNAWQWSTTITPNAANVIAAPIAAVKTTNSSAKATSQKTAKTTTAKTTAKAKGISTTKAKAAAKKKTAKATKTKLTPAAKANDAPQKAPIHPGVLAAVVVLALLYAAYEYRHDIQNRFRKLRHNRAVRAFARQ